MQENGNDTLGGNEDASAAVVRRPTQGTSMSPTYGVVLQTLPATRVLQKESCASLDSDEGIHPTAAERVNENPRKSFYEILLLIGAASIFVVILYIAFPWGYFLKASRSEIPIGPQAERITDEDVQRLGGFGNLTPVQHAVYDITKLRDMERPRAARKKCEGYIDEIQSTTEHMEWMPVWRNYFEILVILEEKDDLKEACRRLKRLNPDSLEAVYYSARIRIQEIPQQSSNEELQDVYREQLERLEKDCRVAVASLEGQKNNPEKPEMLDGFLLLLADIYRRLWWFSGFSWDDENREKAFEYLNKLPGESKQAAKMRLDMYRDCQKEWRHFWRNDPEIRVIDGQRMTEKNLLDQIQQEENNK